MSMNISNTVLEASSVVMLKPVQLLGDSTYTLTTNFIGWGDSNNYRLQDIALTFGTRGPGHGAEVVGATKNAGFRCGNAYISAYDFGLLYTAFTSMIMAKVELGSSFPLFDEKVSGGYKVQWFGNYGLVYSRQKNAIFAIRTQDVEAVCSGKSVLLQNFCSQEQYTLVFDGVTFAIMSEHMGASLIVTTLNVPDCVKRTYSRYFKHADTQSPAASSVDTDSMLGKLINEAGARTECLEVLKNYKTQSFLDSVVSREDLVVVPSERYPDTTNFFGSICYTDKGQIAVAVNYRRGLFVYYPWFETTEGGCREVKVDTSAQFSAFYNVTAGCNDILRFAETVTYRPLSAAEFTVDVYSKVRKAFLDMDLPRIPIQAAFGRVVIPESVLLKELAEDSGETIYCILPVGVVGSKVICLTASGELSGSTPVDWDKDGAFYDITEVIK